MYKHGTKRRMKACITKGHVCEEEQFLASRCYREGMNVQEEMKQRYNVPSGALVFEVRLLDASAEGEQVTAALNPLSQLCAGQSGGQDGEEVTEHQGVQLSDGVHLPADLPLLLIGQDVTESHDSLNIIQSIAQRITLRKCCNKDSNQQRAFLLLHSHTAGAHTPVLEPHLYLSLAQAEHVGHLHTAAAREVPTEVELFLELQHLLARVIQAWHCSSPTENRASFPGTSASL
ncbi:hypothetical protein F7725_023692 [Dissostichus mawsoni]|uniref:Uncharacterized protein n=1 Tax=Dissostichus mawsoni TaxID=36200 RepID=A0A7J5XXZ5_DISMA|nr:hypothetical protein F7725_023692 [Dissostichus mawsoni]